MAYVSDSEKGTAESSSLKCVKDILALMHVVCVAVFLPEVALFGVDETDGGVLLVGVSGDEICTFAGKVFKLHTHCH